MERLARNEINRYFRCNLIVILVIPMLLRAINPLRLRSST